MKRAFILSALFHLALLALLILGVPLHLPTRDEIPEESFEIVDLVEIGDENTSLSEALRPKEKEPEPEPVPTPPPPQPQPPKPEPPKPEPVVTPPARPQPPEPAPPQETDDAPDEAPVVQAPPKPVRKPPEPKPQPQKPAQPTPEKPKTESSLDAWMKANQETPDKTQETPREVPSPTRGGRISEKLTATDLAALKYHVEKEWRLPGDGYAYEGMVVEVIVKTTATGEVLSVEALRDPTLGYDPLYQAFVSSAERAVRFASPLPVPPGKESVYENGIRFQFSPRGLSLR
ncbi:TonB C-terminal domain-containing protein [Phaeovibrio sulfidiphilus]|uniref:TonB C-terminal domain-containing protein n=1 Tax=Phaeovibrio sulfidiphilus TaxID=1220600 RepID=A0A8J6YNK9_9PROT|nr:TonB C-terminal domain-containing protein [Phaeovibrio sulfidiphilus]MBE1236232.1 TonB C-terminal domain-containing protein [Phaeovibrio sulfidiphilus]